VAQDTDPFAETARMPAPDFQAPQQAAPGNSAAPLPLAGNPPSTPKQSWAALPMLSSMGIAIVIHVIIAVAVGSYVVFEGIVPVPFFESDFIDNASQSSVIEEIPTLIEEEPLPTVASSEVETVQEEAGGQEAGPDMSDLITVSSSSLAPSFSMPTTAGNPGLLTGNLFGGTGSGTGDGIGKGKVKLGSLFGSRNLGGGVLTGYLYDFKQNPEKEITEVGQVYTSTSHGERSKAYRTALSEFVDDWDEKELEGYFRTKEPLSLTQFFMPFMNAGAAPTAFEVENEVQPSGWLIVYRGHISPPHSGTFRLAGMGDDVLIARVDGKVVFDGSWSAGYYPEEGVREKIGPSFGGGPGLMAGKWMRLRAGEVYPIDILLGEVPGGSFCAFLMVQEKGVDYEMHPKGYPVLPLLQMMPTEIPDIDERKGYKVLEDGLIFGAK
jgi:hypothetical protein